MELTEAIERAVDECIEEHVLEDFLKKQRAEVIAMSVLEFNLERQLGFARKEGREEGSDLKLISQICRKLKKNKKPEVIAEELEVDYELLERICEVALKFAPEYNVEKIYQALNNQVA